MGNWIYIVAAVVFALIGWPRGIARSWKLFLNLFVAVLIGIWFAPVMHNLIGEHLPPDAMQMRVLIAVVSLTSFTFMAGTIICWLLNGRNKTPRAEEPQYPLWAEVLGGITFGAMTGVTLATFVFFCLTLTPLRFVWRDPGLIALERRAAAHLLLASPYQGEKTATAAHYLQSMIYDVPMPEAIKQKIVERRNERLKQEEEEARQANRPWKKPPEEEPREPRVTEFHSIWDGAFFLAAIPDLDDWQDEARPAAEKKPAKKGNSDTPPDGGPKGDFFQRIRERQNNVVENANSRNF